LRRSSLRILNQSSVPTLLKKIQKNNNATSGQGYTAATNSMILLSYTSKHCPALYKLHVAELTKAIADERNARLAEVSLQALSSLMKWDSNLVVFDKSVHLDYLLRN
jgi:sister-chromatid-cohesion protein PDS5